MQTQEITLEQKIKKEFADVIPSKQTDLSRNKGKGYYNLRELDVIINQAFDRFAYDYNFHRIVKQKPEIMEALKKIKGIYHDKIVSYDLPALNFESMHIREFKAILDPRLSAEEFYKRVRELETSLSKKKMTSISDELRYASLYSMQRKARREKFEVERLLIREAKEKYQQARPSLPVIRQPQIGMEALRASLYQNAVDYIKATPELSLCIKNPESCEFMPQLKLLIGKNESTDKKLSEIFSNNQSTAYKNFISRIRETMKTKNMVLENILKREAMSSGKQPSKFEMINMNPATWSWLSSYYNSNMQVKNFVIKYKEDYAKSLKDLIDETYVKILRTPQSFN